MKAPESRGAKGEKVQTYGNYINGRQVKSETGETFPNYNPANSSDLIGNFAASSTKDVTTAVDAAARALPLWRATLPHRAELILKAAHLLETRKEELAHTMVPKWAVLTEARGDARSN
jgi:aldehyde dehydrogenase (NAD+)